MLRRQLVSIVVRKAEVSPTHTINHSLSSRTTRGHLTLGSLPEQGTFQFSIFHCGVKLAQGNEEKHV